MQVDRVHITIFQSFKYYYSDLDKMTSIARGTLGVHSEFFESAQSI